MGSLAVIVFIVGSYISSAEKLDYHLTDEEIHDVFRVNRNEGECEHFDMFMVFQIAKFALAIAPGKVIARIYFLKGTNFCTEYLKICVQRVLGSAYDNVNLEETPYRKSSPRLIFQTFHRNFTAYLEQSDNVLFGKNTPIFRASRGTNGEITYIRIRNPLHEEFEFSSEEEENKVDGDLLESKNGQRTFKDSQNTTNNVNIRTSPLESHIGKIPLKRAEIPQKSVLRIPRKIHLSKAPSKPNRFQLHVSPEKGVTIYPEILVIVDRRTFSLHGKDLKRLIRYMATFWNGVDLRFREFREPQIRLNIAGIIVPKEVEAVPYLESHRLRNDTELETILASETLETMKHFFNKTFPRDLCPFDVAFAFTPRKLGHIYDHGEPTLYDAIKGITNIGGACRTESGHAVAIVKDNGGFGGVRTAAHELGHLLGAPHDDEESAQINGRRCDPNDGYIMSSLVKDVNSFHWSPCSKRLMQNFIRNETFDCLKNEPDIGKALPKNLPGRSVSRDEQCESIEGFGFKATPGKSNSCTVLSCYKGRLKSTRDLSYFPAEGTTCGERSICLDGECVLDPEFLGS
ncbi:hypothetical protein QAD02_006890 [Eretmocerus hayati]|uniref:Uncharacterized protein n=1 Tax=Eretmocerus hayati TaxID=131215 RepID=A0ACC2N273_9HYME|nr:hypothetical protein QAD02_006890 [Eretmocerus hayati]